MLHLAVQMARHRITALLAVVCAVLGGAALITDTGVLVESGLRSHVPADRLGGADVLVSADQTFHPGPGMPSIALPERVTIPASLADKLAKVPGVTAAAVDLSFPVGLLDARGRVVPVGDARTAGHGWSSSNVLDHPGVDGTEPSGSDEVALDSAIAAAAGAGPGDRVRVVAAGRSADYRVSAVVDAPGAGVLFADTAAAHLAGRDSGPRSGTVDLIGLRTGRRPHHGPGAVRDPPRPPGNRLPRPAVAGGPGLAAPGDRADRREHRLPHDRTPHPPGPAHRPRPCPGQP